MMKTTIILINMVMSSLFLFKTHPLVMGMIIMAQTLLTCLMINLINQSTWIAFMVFLLIMGGLLILFLYIISIAPNEMSQNNPLTTKKTLMMVVTITLIVMLTHTWNMKHFNETCSNNPLIQMKLSEAPLFAKLFNHNMSSMVILLMLILFLNLCIMVSLVSIESGPLRLMQ
uniref:NADH-ubiquinone oxidoreductase chain 6 n=1 Tax=Xenophyes cascus TaxID=984453 RepID=L7NAZ2_9HEMI|nr:NADH dehydrogenase subunit 6 [Xenophyes cascus]